MTEPSSRYQDRGRRVEGPGCLPLAPGSLQLPGTQGSQFLAPPGPLGPLTPPQWDADQQLDGLKGLLSQLCGLLLDSGDPRGAPAEAADSGPPGKADPTSLPHPEPRCPSH